MKKYNYFTTVRKLNTLMVLIVTAGTLPVYAQTPQNNPWLQSSKPLIDGSSNSSGSNSWRNTDSLRKDKIDESKYPPLDENETLGTNYPDVSVDTAAGSTPLPADSGSTFHYPQSQDFEPIPVYPDSSRQNTAVYRDNRYPSYPPAYRRGGYRQAYPAGIGRGYNSFGGFPFGGNSGRGFPFSGNSVNGSPFGSGNSWMPFSGSGFW